MLKIWQGGSLSFHKLAFFFTFFLYLFSAFLDISHNLFTRQSNMTTETSYYIISHVSKLGEKDQLSSIP